MLLSVWSRSGPSRRRHSRGEFFLMVPKFRPHLGAKRAPPSLLEIWRQNIGILNVSNTPAGRIHVVRAYSKTSESAFVPITLKPHHLHTFVLL